MIDRFCFFNVIVAGRGGISSTIIFPCPFSTFIPFHTQSVGSGLLWTECENGTWKNWTNAWRLGSTPECDCESKNKKALRVVEERVRHCFNGGMKNIHTATPEAIDPISNRDVRIQKLKPIRFFKLPVKCVYLYAISTNIRYYLYYCYHNCETSDLAVFCVF